MDDAMIKEAYKPKNHPGAADSWTVGLLNDADRLKEYLGEESLVFQGIKETGELFLRARAIVGELETAGMTTMDDIPVESAKEVCEALSGIARGPYLRFYTVIFVLHSVVQECFLKLKPEEYSQLPWTDAQYHAVVTSALLFQVLSNGMSDDDSASEREVIKACQACIKARANDARMHVMYGNFLMIRGFMNDAKEQLEKAIELDEQGCFGAHYTVANMLENSIPDMAMMGQLSPLQRLQVKSFTQQGQKHLEKYVQLAPKGHWHRHRACILLMFCKARLTARGSER